MSRLQQSYSEIFKDFLSSEKKIKKYILNSEPIQLPFLGDNVVLNRGTVNVFSGHRGQGFGVFINTLAVEVTKNQNMNTLLVSDIILKSYVRQNLSKTECELHHAQYVIEDDFKIENSLQFQNLLESLILRSNISLLVVYPFLMPESQCDTVIERLKSLAEKHNIAVVINLPIDDYMRDQQTLLNYSCADSFLKTLAIEKVFKLEHCIQKKEKFTQGRATIEISSKRENLVTSVNLKIDEDRQILQCIS